MASLSACPSRKLQPLRRDYGCDTLGCSCFLVMRLGCELARISRTRDSPTNPVSGPSFPAFSLELGLSNLG
jgi:hypothetical protein